MKCANCKITLRPGLNTIFQRVCERCHSREIYDMIARGQIKGSQHGFYTGPCAVYEIADAFKRAGFIVSVIGTQNVYVIDEASRAEILNALEERTGTRFGLK